jgi:plastocyanin
MLKTTLFVALFLVLAWRCPGAARAAADPPAPKPGTGTIAGEVLFVGQVPPAEKVFTTDGVTFLHNDLVVDKKTKGLRYVAAILVDAKPQPKLADGKPVEMDQKDMIFLPRVIAVQHGQPVHFTNSDLSNHSVMTATKVVENQFNIFTPFGSPFKFTFKPQPKPVIIGCSLHAWMKAWVYVLEHPWFDVTDAQGKFTIKDVPPGTYTLWLHHADTGKEEKRQVEVKSGEAVKLKVEWVSAGK